MPRARRWSIPPTSAAAAMTQPAPSPWMPPATPTLRARPLRLPSRPRTPCNRPTATAPPTSPSRRATGAVRDALAANVNATGPALVYSTYLGGSGAGWGIAVDGAGSAYVAGWTSSTSFPTKNPLQAVYGGGDTDAFVSKLN